MTLASLLTDAAADLPETEATRSPGGDGLMWSRGGQLFAAISADGAAAEFSLDPAVAAAATRTPDTTPSSRGPGWILFAPVELDDHAIDRAVAWLASAYRRLGPHD